jgi:hypothetical protein
VVAESIAARAQERHEHPLKFYLTMAVSVVECICAIALETAVLACLTWVRHEWRQEPSNRRFMVFGLVVLTVPLILLVWDLFRRIYG